MKEARQREWSGKDTYRGEDRASTMSTIHLSKSRAQAHPSHRAPLRSKRGSLVFAEKHIRVQKDLLADNSLPQHLSKQPLPLCYTQ